LRIDVVDTGVGIEPEQVERIFGEFTRLGTVEVEGFGLGLALAERIARLLGGSITVRSTPGRGSRFSLYLPALPDEPVDGQTELAAVPAPVNPRAALDVLVVDNDPRIVDASLVLLERLGHHAIGAADIAGAVPHSRRVDAVLADFRLDNGEDGIELIAAMRAEAPGLAAVIISAEDGPELRQRAAALGVSVLAKPVSVAEIEAFLAGIG
jgi:CheY-like chemotaxis protein